MIDILKQAAYEGGKVAMSYFRKECEVNHKTSHQNLVTVADIASQEVIKETILKLMSVKGYHEEEIGFLGEEHLSKSGKFMFVIDPIDGTTNFASGLEQFCVLIACFKEKELVAGMAYVPPADQYYYAEKDKGTYKEENGIKTRLNVEKRRLENGLLGIYVGADVTARDTLLKRTLKLLPEVRGLRVIGNDFIYFIENKYTVTLNSKGYLWDVAAPFILINEAGGEMYDWNGKKLVLELDNVRKQYATLLCHPDNLKEVMSLVR